MARADKKLAEEKIAAIRARFQNPDVHRFLHDLPVFRVEPELPQSLEDKLRRLDEAEREDDDGGKDRH